MARRRTRRNPPEVVGTWTWHIYGPSKADLVRLQQEFRPALKLRKINGGHEMVVEEFDDVAYWASEMQPALNGLYCFMRNEKGKVDGRCWALYDDDDGEPASQIVNYDDVREIRKQLKRVKRDRN